MSVAKPYSTKTFTFTCKAVDDEQGLIEAYGSVFNNVDQGGDRVQPGAFKRTIQNRQSSVQAGKSAFLWPMLWQHDQNLPIGGWYEAEEDQYGLRAKGRLVLTTQLGRDVYELIKAGVIREFSIGYEIPSGGSSYDKSGVRDLKEVRLWEISPVTFAMNDQALLVGVKRMDDKPKQRKDFNSFHQSALAADSMDDWYNYITYPLTKAMIEAFTMGDQPVQDMQAVCEQFTQAVLAWTEEAVENGFSQYLAEQNQVNSYGWMSRRPALTSKAGARFSQESLDMLGQHISNLHDAGDQLHQMAEDLANNTGATTYADSSGHDADPEDGDTPSKSNPFVPRARRTLGKHSSPARDTANEREITAALTRLRQIKR